MNATITFIEKEEFTPKLPFFAKNDQNQIIFVTEDNYVYYGGYLVKGNDKYKPFEYHFSSWDRSEFKPFHGKITIDIP